ncbi:MAG: DNA-directed RNA polymerase subunit N [Candidatus Micrarchaeota archaeon]|nr:DNA-directed RNA polymerase subunit N [Candidatus Micrarchaeota archaeon]
MMIPVRCFSCGQVVADKWEEFNTRTKTNKEDPAKVLDSMGIKRYCCRRMLISHKDLIDEVVNYSRK